MGWPYLGIFFVLSLLVCLCGFKKYVYFMSIGYGFSVAAIGAALAVMSAAGVCDFEPLNAMFFPVQSIGFLLAGAGVLAMLLRPARLAPAVAAPVIYRGTFLFVGLMVAGLAALDAGLGWLAVKKCKKPAAAVLLALSFVCSLGMGYLSSRDFAAAAANWAAEGVNAAGQGLFLLAVRQLHKAGLADCVL